MRFEKTPRSLAREALAAAIRRLTEATAAVDALQAALGRLTESEALSAPVEAELGRLDAAEAAALAAWCRTPDAPRPQPDVEARSRLLRELDAARTTAASAARASGSVSVELNGAIRCYAGSEIEVNAATAEVVAEEVELAAAEMAARIAEAHRAKLKVDAGRAVVLRIAETTKAPDVFRRLERLDGAIGAASGIPAPDLLTAYAATAILKVPRGLVLIRFFGRRGGRAGW